MSRPSPGHDGRLRLAAAARLARAGGQIAIEHWSRAPIAWKADDSMMTAADLAIQACLDREIAAAFPDDGVLGEENGASPPRRLEAPHVWIVDPIDGTNNFGRGLPGFSVSVGVLRYGRPFCGAVYDPLSGHLFTGLVGQGAWLNERPLRVTPTALSSRSLFCVRTPYRDGVPAFVQRWLGRYRLRRVGSTALHLCYVASGALAFVHDQRAMLWDIAGAAPVLIEAGGILTGERGSPLFPLDPDGYDGQAIAFLAGDPLAHDESLRDVLVAGAGTTSSALPR
ncbi:MAG TPA: inositol monophosphatase [Methylomirabilota bacterium]|jgi:myo-inositol-1(or 4)-monophosphatase